MSSSVRVSTDQATAPSAKSTVYFPAVDGLRAVAVLLVFAAHYLARYAYIDAIAKWGWAGVDIFFVLSGFLITGILYDTRHRGNFFGSFYLRRSLRIFPLFYGVIIAILLLGCFGHPLYNRYNLAVPLYLENFFGVLHAEGCTVSIVFGHKTLLIGLGHFWSLALEEQFYLLWPISVWLVKDRLSLSRVCVGVSVFVLLLRTYLRFHLPPALAASDYLYNQSFTRVDALLIGAWVALWMRKPGVTITRLRNTGRWLFPAALSAWAVGELIVARHHVAYCDDAFCSSLGFTLIDLAAAGLLMLVITPGTAAFRLLKQRPLMHLGRISYGFYVFHALPAYVLFGVETQLAPRHLGWVAAVIAFALQLRHGVAQLPILGIALPPPQRPPQRVAHHTAAPGGASRFRSTLSLCR